MVTHVIRNEAELEEYTGMLFELTAKPEPSGADVQMIELLDLLIEKYETEHFPIPKASPVEVLRYLMESHSLQQQDLVPQLGSTPLVSLILAGKRNLTVQHIRALSERFHLRADVFVGTEISKPTAPQKRVDLKASSGKEPKRHRVAVA